MKILVIGSGAVGGYFGGKLAQAGHEVFFMARGEHLNAINQNGLAVESINGDFKVRSAWAAERFQPIDGLNLVLVCVKRTDTGSVTEVLKEQAGGGRKATVISLQNGVDVEKELASAVRVSNLMGGVAFLGSEVSAPGRIKHSAGGILTIGELDGSQTERALGLKKMFDAAGVRCSVSTDIIGAKWEKLMWNAGFNAVCGLTGRTVRQIADFPPACGLIRSLMTEVADVAEKIGVKVSRPLAEKYLDNARKGGDVTPSMLQDVRRGKRTEIDYINGKVRDEGRNAKVPTPCNDMIWTLVSAMDHK